MTAGQPVAPSVYRDGQGVKTPARPVDAALRPPVASCTGVFVPGAGAFLVPGPVALSHDISEYFTM